MKADWLCIKITALEQKRPISFQDAPHNDYFKKVLVKFIFSIWSEEKYETILQKEFCVNCVISAFSIVGKNNKNRRYIVMV